MHATAVLAADYRTLDLAETTGVVGRTSLQSGAPGALPSTTRGVDALIEPKAHFAMGDRRWLFELRDQIVITVPDLELGIGCAGCVPVQTLDFADVSLSWHDRRVRLAVDETASGGLYNSGNLTQAPVITNNASGPPPPSTPTPVQVLPAPSTITLGSSRTAATMDVRLDRRALASVTASYLVFGGLTTESQAILPLQRTARADAFLDYAVSRRDRLSTLGYAQDTQFGRGPCFAIAGANAAVSTNAPQCAPHDVLVQVDESWIHALDRGTSTTLSAGITGARVTGSIAQPSFWCSGSNCLFPVADAAVISRFGERGETLLRFDASFVPLVDTRTGLVSDRSQLVASLGERVTKEVGVLIDLVGSQTVPPSDPFAATIVGGGVDVGFRVNRTVLLDLNQRTMWENQSEFGEFFSSVTSLTVTVSSPVEHL
jgi:hypothetical protein